MTGALGDGEVAELQLIGGLDEAHAEGAEIEQDFFDIDVVETLFGYLRTDKKETNGYSQLYFSEEKETLSREYVKTIVHRKYNTFQ